VDTYSTQNFWYAVILAGLAKKFHKKYVLILHGGSLENRFRDSPKVTAYLFKNAYKIVSPSLYLKEKVESLGHFSVEYIPNPFHSEEYDFQLRSQISPKLFWVRAFNEIYNPLLALKTLEILFQKYPESELCMIGPTKDESYRICVNYAQKYQLPVKFTGKLSKAKWKELSKKYDIFLNTTFIDNVPVSVLEAMALGLPVISTNVGGIPYIIKEGETGLMIPPDNAEKMAEAVIKLMINSSLAKNISKNAREQVQQMDWEHIKPLWRKLLF
ncbi:MAG: glycosyltransferase family 4 protein, partial [Gillisia sp.]